MTEEVDIHSDLNVAKAFAEENEMTRFVMSQSRTIEEVNIEQGVMQLVGRCYNDARRNGWYTDLDTGEDKKINFGERIALVHSELSEALEADRKGLMDEKMYWKGGVECELADAVIRIMDMAGHLQIPLGETIIQKLRYNRYRADHKVENRKSQGGKKY